MFRPKITSGVSAQGHVPSQKTDIVGFKINPSQRNPLEKDSPATSLAFVLKQSQQNLELISPSRMEQLEKQILQLQSDDNAGKTNSKAVLLFVHSGDQSVLGIISQQTKKLQKMQELLRANLISKGVAAPPPDKNLKRPHEINITYPKNSVIGQLQQAYAETQVALMGLKVSQDDIGLSLDMLKSAPNSSETVSGLLAAAHKSVASLKTYDTARHINRALTRAVSIEKPQTALVASINGGGMSSASALPLAWQHYHTLLARLDTIEKQLPDEKSLVVSPQKALEISKQIRVMIRAEIKETQRELYALKNDADVSGKNNWGDKIAQMNLANKIHLLKSKLQTLDDAEVAFTRRKMPAQTVSLFSLLLSGTQSSNPKRREQIAVEGFSNALHQTYDALKSNLSKPKDIS